MGNSDDIAYFEDSEAGSSTSRADASSDTYSRKYAYLKEKYQMIEESTCQLRQRLLHVEKEILQMQRLKRVLLHRLMMYGDSFAEIPLEIPDDIANGEDADTKRRRERREKERERKEAIRQASAGVSSQSSPNLESQRPIENLQKRPFPSEPVPSSKTSGESDAKNPRLCDTVC